MPQTKKKKVDSRSVEKSQGSNVVSIDRQRRWTTIIVVAMVIAIILIIIGFFYHREYVAPFNRTIITVDSTTIDAGYFLKRARLAGSATSALQGLTNELLIKLAAPQYVGEVSPEDIDQELRRIARGESENISESEFEEWYRQQLNETRFSDAEYRDVTAAGLLATRLQEYLAERMPTVAEQAHVHIITLNTYEDAVKTRARWEAGEDFANLAREVSTDSEAGENGGDFGWLPSGVLISTLDYEAFNLSTSNVSAPLAFASDPSSEEVSYCLLMVSEKADAREIDEKYLPVLESKLLQDWLLQQMQTHNISYNYNSEIDAWINWQLSKMTDKDEEEE